MFLLILDFYIPIGYISKSMFGKPKFTYVRLVKSP